MSTIVIKYDGTDITDDIVFSETRFTSVADGQAGTATIVIDDEHQQYDADSFITGATLELIVDGTREWDGWVFNVTRGWPFTAYDTSVPTAVPRKWTIEGFDRNLLLTKRILHNVSNPESASGFKIWPEDTMDRTAILHSLNNYVDLTGDGLDISSGIKQVSSPGPFEEFQLGANALPWAVMFNDAAQMTGAVYYIDPDRVVRYNDDLTVTAPFTISDTPTAGQVGYREFEAILDFTEAANEAIVLGAGGGSANPVGVKYTNDTSVSAHGLWQWGDVFVGAYKQGTVNKRARTYVEGSPSHQRGHDEPVPTVRCTVFTPGIRAGMVVLIVSSIFAYSEALPVRNVTMTFPTPTSVRYDLEASLKIDAPYSAPDRLPPLAFPPFPPGEEPPPIGGIPWPPFPEPPEFPTGSDNLIDHFDQIIPNIVATVTTDITVGFDGVAVINLPDGLDVADRLLLLYPAGGSAVANGLTDIIMDEWQDPVAGGASFQLTWGIGALYWGHYTSELSTAVFTGTGDTISVTGIAENTEVTAIAVLVENVAIPTAEESATAHIASATVSGLDPPSVAPGWDVATRWFAMGHVSDAGDSPTITGEIGFDDIYYGVNLNYAFRVETYLSPDGSAVDPASTMASTSTFKRASTLAIEGVSGAVGVLKTPGPEVTGAAWPGGNTWTQTNNYTDDGTDIDVVVAESILYGTGTSGHFSITINDTVMDLIDDVDNDYEYLTPTFPLESWPTYVNANQPWWGGSTPTWSDGLTAHAPDILVKWRMNGAAFGDEELWFRFQLFTDAGDGTDDHDLWLTTAQFDIGTQPSIYVNPGFMDNGIDSHEYAQHAYYYGASSLALEPGTWYWARMRVGLPNFDQGWPYGTGARAPMDATGWNLSGLKLWKDGDAEPVSDGLSGTYNWYWAQDSFPELSIVGGDTDGWTMHLPQTWRTNRYDADPWFDEYLHAYNYGSELRISVYNPSSTTGRYEIDGVWEYRDYLDGGDSEGSALAVEYFSGTITDYATAVDWNGTTVTYSTSAPYAPGTLVVIHNGVKLRPGIDFVELDPRAGTFVVTGFDISGNGLVVLYEPTGDVGTTAVYSSQSGSDGTVSAGTSTFTSPTASFTQSDVGNYIIIGDTTYTIATVVDANTITVVDGPIVAPDGVDLADVEWSLQTSQGGDDGVVISGTSTFTAPSASFEASDVGSNIIIDGSIYTIATVVDSSTITVSDGPIVTIDGQDTTTAEWLLQTEPPILQRPDIVLLHGWGSINDPYNSIMACSAMALNRHTSGTYSKFTGTPRSNPLTHRSYSGLADSVTPTLSDAVTAWSAGWSQTMTTGTYTWSEFDSMLTEGRGALLVGDHEQLTQDWGDVPGHCLYINDKTTDGTYFGYDPRHGYPLLYTESELQAYAVGHTVAGKVVAGFTAVT